MHVIPESKAVMRRNWFTILLFAMALALQVVAPVAVNVAMATRAEAAAVSAGGVIAAGELCLKDAGAGGPSREAPAHLKGHRDACLLCQAYCGGVAPVGARAARLGMAPVHWTALAWTQTDRVLPAAPHDYSRLARGPPSNS